MVANTVIEHPKGVARLFVERFCGFLFRVVTRHLVYLIQRKKHRSQEDCQEHLESQKDTDRAFIHTHLQGLMLRLFA